MQRPLWSWAKVWRKHFFSQKNSNTYNVYSLTDVYSLYTSTMYPILPYLCAVSSKACGNASFFFHGQSRSEADMQTEFKCRRNSHPVELRSNGLILGIYTKISAFHGLRANVRV